MMEKSGLTLENIHKQFGETVAVEGVSFQVKRGKILGILGPSGSGKTTVLEIIAGLVSPDRGSVAWDGRDLAGTPPYKRGFGLMFQEYALFPHKNVEENVAFGLAMQNWSREKIEQRVDEVLSLVGLPEHGDREVDTLSGGERQRVALARALAPQPRLLMLDEPIGSLDRTLRERLMGELRDILKSMSQTALYVTHDQVEAFTVADRIVIMREGRVAQIGRPEEIYQHPDSTFVARFLGLTNLIPGSVSGNGDSKQVSTALGTWTIGDEIDGKVTVLLRPDEVNIGPAANPGEVELEGILTKKSFSGKFFRCEVESQGYKLQFEFPARTKDMPETGQRIRLHFNPESALQVYPESPPQPR